MDFYLDGVLQTSAYSALGNAPIYDRTAAFCIGKDAGTTSQGTHYLAGSISEVEVQDTMRDAGWIALSYQTQGPSYSTYISFGAPQNTAGAPSFPTLSFPVNKSMNLPTSLTLTWDTVSTAISYGVQLSTDIGFFSTVFGATGLTSTLQPVSGLSYNTTYYWEANAANAVGTGAWSSVSSFATSGNGVLLQNARFNAVNLGYDGVFIVYSLNGRQILKLPFSAAMTKETMLRAAGKIPAMGYYNYRFLKNRQVMDEGNFIVK